MVNKTDVMMTCVNMVFLYSFFACLPLFMHISIRPIFVLQVQDIEFAQIEMKVIEGLKVGNDCLKKMHEVRSEN